MKDDREQTKSGSTFYKDKKNIKRKREKDTKEFLCFDEKPSSPAKEQIIPGLLFSSPGGSVRPAQNLFKDIVKGLYITYFQNPDQKHKNVVRVRFNLDTDENPEFLAFMHTRWADFRRNADDEIIEWMEQARIEIKEMYGVKPYMGKFVLEQKGFGTNPGLESNTAMALWWDNTDRDEDTKKGKWKGIIKFKSFEMSFVFEEEFLTSKQKANNVRATAYYRRDEVKRSKSWSDRNPRYK